MKIDQNIHEIVKGSLEELILFVQKASTNKEFLISQLFEKKLVMYKQEEDYYMFKNPRTVDFLWDYFEKNPVEFTKICHCSMLTFSFEESSSFNINNVFVHRSSPKELWCSFEGTAVASHHQYSWPINSKEKTYGEIEKETISQPFSFNASGSTMLVSIRTCHPSKLDEDQPQRVFKLMDASKRVYFNNVVKELLVDGKTKVEVIVLGLSIAPEQAEDNYSQLDTE